MRISAKLKEIGRAGRRLLRLLARPVRIGHGRGGLVILPYRGYGSRREIFLMGRVLRQGTGSLRRLGPLGRDLADLGRRLLRRGVAGASLDARFGAAQQRVFTDQDGYFRIRLQPAQAPPPDRLWHRMELELVTPAAGAGAEGEFFVPPEGARFVVISDIDDTVIFTGVAGKVKMLWRLFVQGARSRVAFPGVAAFYRALHRDSGGLRRNPLLYVSRGPWGIYEVLDEFFHRHAIPVGPILFLREWGLTLRHPFPRRARGHKLALIRQMLALYAELPFVLIGDSGQRDPEIYAQVVRENPGRVLAIYIRNVSREPQRQAAIEDLAQEVAAAGSSLLLAADSFAMAEHAANHGLIPPETLAGVLAERKAQQGRADLKPKRKVKQPTPSATRKAVARGELRKALHADTGDQSPPNIVVEPEERKSAPRSSRQQAGKNDSTR